MKRKMLLPLLAVVFAALAAFASVPPQDAWYKPASLPAVTGTITTPDPITNKTCQLSGENLCMIGSFQAYDTEAHANAQGDDGVLRYN